MAKSISAIGIDFGSDKSTIAAVLNSGVEILTNQASNRETPNMIAFNSD